jgi:hypothetical protein
MKRTRSAFGWSGANVMMHLDNMRDRIEVDQASN